MSVVRYTCPKCPNTVGVSVTLAEPPVCHNPKHPRRQSCVMIATQPIVSQPTVEQLLEELL